MSGQTMRNRILSHAERAYFERDRERVIRAVNAVIASDTPENRMSLDNALLAFFYPTQETPEGER